MKSCLVSGLVRATGARDAAGRRRNLALRIGGQSLLAAIMRTSRTAWAMARSVRQWARGRRWRVQGYLGALLDAGEATEAEFG